MEPDISVNGGAPKPPAAALIITMSDEGAINVQYPPNEMIARYLLDKLRATVDDEFRRLNTPRVIEGKAIDITRHLRS